MSNELQNFTNQAFGTIRAVEIDGKPMFCAKDVAVALGYQNTNDAITKHCHGVAICYPIVDSLGREQDARFISEGDMYRLAASSKLEGAQEFESWIFDEVIPSIREHGAYATPVTIDNIINDPEFGIRLLTQLKESQDKNRQISGELEAKSEEIKKLQPKASYYDTVLQCHDTVTISAIAKDYGMSGMAMNKLLHDYKIQYKQSKRWYLYADYDGFNYATSRTAAIVHSNGDPGATSELVWTQAGRKFLYEFLKEKGILPCIEKTKKEAEQA